MATTAVVELQTGTRRAVVRSERFMEWHRELSSTRATYGARRRHDDSDISDANFAKKCYGKRHSSDEDAAKVQKPEVSDEKDGQQEEDPTADSNAAEPEDMDARKKPKKQQLPRKGLNGKNLRRKQDIEEKRLMLVSAKELEASPDREGGRMRRCKQQVPNGAYTKRQQQSQHAQQYQQTILNAANRRPQRHIPRSHSPPKDQVERSYRFMTRNRGNVSPPPALPPCKASKRSKRVAQRLANEEPPPPPLKLPKLHLVLTRKEIQEDWMKITGHKYSGKPKKSTLIQRGLGLCTSLTCPSSIRYLNDPQCK